MPLVDTRHAVQRCIRKSRDQPDNLVNVAEVSITDKKLSCDRHITIIMSAIAKYCWNSGNIFLPIMRFGIALAPASGRTFTKLKKRFKQRKL